jgi:CRP/FNR family transcriptional regulator, cyclic AMP receptor protein
LLETFNAVTIANRFSEQNLLARIGSGKTTRNYLPDKTVFRQGDSADSLFYIVKGGRIKITMVSKLGKEAVVSIAGQGDFVGIDCLAGKLYCTATATVMTNCTVIRIEKEAAARAIYHDPALAEVFLTYLVKRNIRIQEDLVDQIFNSSEKRLARLLLLLTGEEKTPLSKKKISHETLAGMIGTTRSRVCHFMNKFRKLGFIEYGDDLIVHSTLLRAVLNDEPTFVEKP